MCVGGKNEDKDTFTIGLEGSLGFKVAFYDIYTKGQERNIGKEKVLLGGY